MHLPTHELYHRRKLFTDSVKYVKNLHLFGEYYEELLETRIEDITEKYVMYGFN